MFKIIRENIDNKVDTLSILLHKDTIQISSISYSDILDNNIGYIKIEQFTAKSFMEFSNSFYELIKMKELDGLIIDLRGNGGGIMQEAIKICNMFVPYNSLILSTKGNNVFREYRAIYQPIDTLLPLVVLIDEESASASEIVAGCLQDLDRALIIGNSSFGRISAGNI